MMNDDYDDDDHDYGDDDDDENNAESGWNVTDYTHASLTLVRNARLRLARIPRFQ